MNGHNPACRAGRPHPLRDFPRVIAAWVEPRRSIQRHNPDMSVGINDQEDILQALKISERRFREEHHRHRATIMELRRELHDLVTRGEQLGISRTSMSKAMHVSTHKLKQLLEKRD
jgi:hypothetical protein